MTDEQVTRLEEALAIARQLNDARKQELIRTVSTWIGADDEDAPVQQHEKEAVDRGLAEIEANPKGGMTFEEFQKRIRLTPRGSQTEGDNKS